MSLKQLLPAFVIIIFAVILRLLPHPPNVAPITAMALFGGAYLNKKYALIIPLVALFLSDIFIGFHDTMLFVYGSFFVSGIIGIFLSKRKSTLNILIGTFTASLLFYLLTNFGVWAVSAMYSKTFQGLIQSYIMGIPFYRNTMLGDFFFTGLFFIAYEIVTRVIYFSKKAYHFSRK